MSALLARRVAFILVTLPLLIANLGSAAEPIREGPRAESLVEGHVVWLVIDAYQTEGPPNATWAPAQRPHPSPQTPVSASDVLLRIDRFAGLLWFNDQYVVPPETDVVQGLGTGTRMRSHYAAGLAVMIRADDGTGIREPCGGAIMAVDSGSPDPRGALVTIDGRDPLATDPARGGDSAWVGVDTQEPGVFSDGVVTSNVGALVGSTGVLPYDYVESYRVTDPDGMTWVVDKYNFVDRLVVAGGNVETAYEYPVWVVNLFGTETFVPDDVAGISTGRFGNLSDCRELSGLADALAQPVTDFSCGVDVFVAGLNAPTLPDDPCMGYLEPSHNGYCYGGQADPTNMCPHEFGEKPLRHPRAFLYFRWEDLQVPGAPVSHADPLDPSATNGCQSGTDWPCPGEIEWDPFANNDDAEGNSHSFHARIPPHLEAEPCEVLAPNPTNHGGSPDGEAGTCNYDHATALVDVYYSATARPAAPLVRYFAIDDLFGSSDPFHDFHNAYPEIL